MFTMPLLINGHLFLSTILPFSKHVTIEATASEKPPLPVFRVSIYFENGDSKFL
jgi:hypothetical protein